MRDEHTDKTLTRDNLDGYDEWTHPIENFTQIVASESGGVYRVQTGDGTKFLRVLDSPPAEQFIEILQSNDTVGFPSSRILVGDPPLLMMDEAQGRPLSRVYPIVTFPLLWWYFGSDIRTANERLGTYLGRLHRETKRGVRPLRSTSFEKYRTNVEGIEKVLEDKTLSRIDTIVDRLDDAELSSCLVHGDPTPHNLFYRDADLTLIDFSLDLDAVVRDVINAERGIELMIGRLPHGRSNQSATLVEAFRSGYQEAFPSFERPERFEQLRCVSDAYLLSLQLKRTFDKRGARVAQRTDVRLLANRIRAALS